MRRGVLPVSLPSKARWRSPSLTTYYHASNGFADDTALVEAVHAIKGMSSRPMAGGACGGYPTTIKVTERCGGDDSPRPETHKNQSYAEPQSLPNYPASISISMPDPPRRHSNQPDHSQIQRLKKAS